MYVYDCDMASYAYILWAINSLKQDLLLAIWSRRVAGPGHSTQENEADNFHGLWLCTSSGRSLESRTVPGEGG